MQCPTHNEREGRDPLAHYLKAGRPEGSWVHSVVRFDETTLKNFVQPLVTSKSVVARVALHGHFHYTDHLGDFIRALTSNM